MEKSGDAKENCEYEGSCKGWIVIVIGIASPFRHITILVWSY
jgi:hypothetical protein